MTATAFTVHRITHEPWPGVGGVYIFVRHERPNLVGERKLTPLFIGETDDFAEAIRDHRV